MVLETKGSAFLVVLPAVDGVPMVSLRIAQVYASNTRVSELGMGGEQ